MVLHPHQRRTHHDDGPHLLERSRRFIAVVAIAGTIPILKTHHKPIEEAREKRCMVCDTVCFHISPENCSFTQCCSSLYLDVTNFTSSTFGPDTV